MRMILMVLCSLALLPRGGAAQTVGGSPQEVAERFVGAMRAGDYSAMAALMHVDALRDMREYLSVLFEEPDADDYRQQLLGVSSVEEARALSDTAVFAALMRVSIQQDPRVVELLQNAQIDFLGRVDEGSDTTHIVYRMVMTMEGTPISRMDVMSLGRSGHGWRGLLKGDISALARAISAAVERRR